MPQRIEPGLTSVIVVTANSGPVLARCVEGVLASSAPIELIVVDNASCDGRIDALEQRYRDDRRIRILRNARNIGFGPACNRGAAMARGDGLLFLNPDCLIDVDTVAALRSAQAGHPDAGVFGVQVLDASGKVESAGRRRDPILRRALNTMTGLARFEARWPALAGVDMRPASRQDAVEPVDAISGACMFVPRPVFDSLAGFDEGYFLHCEDLDLCRRARDAGHGVLQVASIHVRHEQGSSSHHRPLFVSRHKHRGMWRYFRAHDPAARNPLLRALVGFGIWTHFAALAPLHAWRQLRGRRR